MKKIRNGIVKMKIKYFTTLLLILMWFIPSLAQQQITFDDQGWTTDQSLGSGFSIDGIVFSSAKNFYTNYGFNFDVYNTSIYYMFQNPAVDQFVITNTDNRSFDLTSIATYQVSENTTDSLVVEGWNGTIRKYRSAFANINTWKTLILNYKSINKVVVKIKSTVTSVVSDYNFDNFAFSNVELPVELVSFDGSAEKNNIKLRWSTATEVDNYGFDVERKENNSWEKIGFVEGNGTTNSPKSYTFVDSTVISGIKYTYRLKQIDNSGDYKYSDEKEIKAPAIQVSHDLAQNYPNPFNATTVINYQIDQEGPVSLKVYDVLGKEVSVLVNETKSAGKYSVSFNCTDLASGIYIYKFVSNGFVSTKKMLLVK